MPATASATDMADDWRIRMTLPTHRGLGWIADRLGARDLGRELARDLGDRIAVSRDHEELFLYAGSESAARAAEQVVRHDLDLRGWSAAIELTRWHEDAHEWRPPGAPLAETASQRAAEHAELIAREDDETARDGRAH